MENWFPEAHQVRMRAGSLRYDSNFFSATSTGMAYNGPAGSEFFVASGVGGGAGQRISKLPFDATKLSINLTSNEFSFTNFQTAAGTFLTAVNGTDNLRLYNGTSWTTVTGVSVPAITGVPTNELVYVASMINRLWFARLNSMTAYYLPVDSIGGALAAFPLGTVFRRGGSLTAFSNWSLDAGDGMDDYTIFVSSEGEMAVYRGTDPATAATWALVGVYYIGEPVTRKCLTPFGGDLLYLCKTGLFPLSKALQSASIDRRAALTDKINVAFSQAVESYGTLSGWQVIVFPGGPFILVNVPTSTTTSEQFVMNTLTGAWCKFTGWDASSWEVFDERLYFVRRDFGAVIQAWTGTFDDDPTETVPTPIASRCQQAFNYFGRRGQQKHMKLLRPLLTIDAEVVVRVGVDVDFVTNDESSLIAPMPGVAFTWDTAVWDAASWTPAVQILRNWATITNQPFFAAAMRLQISSAVSTVRWTATDFVLESGGVL